MVVNDDHHQFKDESDCAEIFISGGGIRLDMGVDQKAAAGNFVFRLMVVNDDHLDPLPDEIVDRLMSVGATVQCDKEVGAPFFKDTLNRFLTQPISLLHAPGDIKAGGQSEITQGVDQLYRTGDAIDIIVAKDNQVLLLIDRLNDAVCRGPEVIDLKRIRQLLQFRTQVVGGFLCIQPAQNEESGKHF